MKVAYIHFDAVVTVAIKGGSIETVTYTLTHTQVHVTNMDKKSFFFTFFLFFFFDFLALRLVLRFFYFSFYFLLFLILLFFSLCPSHTQTQTLRFTLYFNPCNGKSCYLQIPTNVETVTQSAQSTDGEEEKEKKIEGEREREEAKISTVAQHSLKLFLQKEKWQTSQEKEEKSVETVTYIRRKYTLHTVPVQVRPRTCFNCSLLCFSAGRERRQEIGKEE